MIHTGDCVEVMAAMDAESIDAIVTDPPYLIQFMGKTWDGPGKTFLERKSISASGGFDAIAGNHHPTNQADVQRTALSQGLKMQAFHEAWATEALRVAKPGAYLLAFGGTRTVHRLTVALEDAGWIIRDTLMWVYASGFPKSRALLKPAYEPIVMARKPGPLRELRIDGCRIGTEVETWPSSRSFAPGISSGNTEGREKGPTQGTGEAPPGRWPANVILTDPVFDGGMSRFFCIPEGAIMCACCGTAKSAEQGTSHDGGRTASVPSHAPTGASPDTVTRTAAPTTSATETLSSPSESETTAASGLWLGSQPSEPSPSDPASNAAASATSSGITTTTPDRWMCDSCVADAMHSYMAERESGEPLRAFLVPKASRKDREPDVAGDSPLSGGTSWDKPLRECNVCGSRTKPAGPSPERWPDCEHEDWTWVDATPKPRRNTHPTVKPTALMRHLIRLVTPEGGTILDPFLGSGTTAKAATLEGVEWVGIERDPESVRIAEQRLVGLKPESEQLEWQSA